MNNIKQNVYNEHKSLFIISAWFSTDTTWSNSHNGFILVIRIIFNCGFFVRFTWFLSVMHRRYISTIWLLCRWRFQTQILSISTIFRTFLIFYDVGSWVVFNWGNNSSLFPVFAAIYGLHTDVVVTVERWNQNNRTKYIFF